MAPRFFTSAVDASEWTASRTGRFILNERGSDTHWIGMWIEPTVDLEAVHKRKQYFLSLTSNPGLPALSTSTARNSKVHTISETGRVSVSAEGVGARYSVGSDS
jgi:hypothetical protein